MRATEVEDVDVRSYREDDDVISLADLALVLVRRKVILAVVTGACVLLGVALAVARPKTYAYETILEIGHDAGRLIESPETVKAKLEDGYIPLVLRHQKQKDPDGPLLHIKTSIPRNSQVIRLEIDGPQKVGPEAVALLTAVTGQIAADHERTIKIRRQALEGQREKLRNDAAGLRDNVATLEAQVARIEKTRKLLLRQRSDAQKLVDAGIANRKAAQREVRDEAKAMTLLMIENDIRQAQSYIDKIDERLHIELPTRGDQLQKQIADTKRDVANTEERIRQTELELANISETRALVPPARSIGPKGPRRLTIVALSLVVGFMLAVITAFIAEFIANLKTRGLEKSGA